MGSDDTTVSHAEMENARVTQELPHIVILIKKHSTKLEEFIPYGPYVILFARVPYGMITSL